MNIFFIGVVVSILVYIVVGIWAGRSVKDVNDYYVIYNQKKFLALKNPKCTKLTDNSWVIDWLIGD